MAIGFYGENPRKNSRENHGDEKPFGFFFILLIGVFRSFQTEHKNKIYRTHSHAKRFKRENYCLDDPKVVTTIIGNEMAYYISYYLPVIDALKDGTSRDVNETVDILKNT